MLPPRLDTGVRHFLLAPVNNSNNLLEAILMTKARSSHLPDGSSHKVCRQCLCTYAVQQNTLQGLKGMTKPYAALGTHLCNSACCPGRRRTVPRPHHAVDVDG